MLWKNNYGKLLPVDVSNKTNLIESIHPNFSFKVKLNLLKNGSIKHMNELKGTFFQDIYF